MGEVYLAQDARLGRNVAVKLLEPSLAADSAWRTRFLREARLASSLDHPNICAVYEVGEADGRPFIAMQYVEGSTLRDVIGKRPLKLDSLLSIALQVASALAAAHDKGVVHRDIKSANIMISPDGQAKVLDFGLARSLDVDREQESVDTATHLTVTGLVMGTPATMSPEQARGERVDHRSDIFSFGVVLYEMATGVTPFASSSNAGVIAALLTEAPAPAATVNPQIPAGLSAVIDRALAKDAADRYQSMRELIADLRQVVADAGGIEYLFKAPVLTPGLARSLPPKAGGGRLARIASRARIAVLLVTVAVLGIVGLAMYSSWRPRREPTAATQATSIDSIAVLPFKPLVPDHRDEALEMGMADTLIARLSTIRNINVRPISAVRKYTGLEQDAAAAGREQQVDAVLDGQIQRADGRLRVTVQLVSAADGRKLWGDQFDESLTDIFSVQDAVASRVSSALALTLSREEAARLTKRHTNNVEAYQLYVLGRYHLNRLTDDGFRQALQYFTQAAAKDPEYALAHAGIAQAYNQLSGFNAIRPQDGYPRAREAAERALRLDSTLAEARIAIATITFFYEWKWAEADSEFRNVLQSNPGSSEGHMTYGLFLSAMGRFDEAVGETRRALDLDPASIATVTALADTFYLGRRFASAEAQYRKALAMDPNSGLAYWGLGRTLNDLGRYDEAIAALRKSIPLSGDSPDEAVELARAWARSGRKEEALKTIEDLKESSRRRYIAPVPIGVLYAELGRKDDAFAWLERGRAERDFLLVLLKVEPMYDTLRGDPRFTRLLDEMRLTPGT